MLQGFQTHSEFVDSAMRKIITCKQSTSWSRNFENTKYRIQQFHIGRLNVRAVSFDSGDI